jgi:hypothetical protein
VLGPEFQIEFRDPEGGDFGQSGVAGVELTQVRIDQPDVGNAPGSVFVEL